LSSSRISRIGHLAASVGVRTPRGTKGRNFIGKTITDEVSLREECLRRHTAQQQHQFHGSLQDLSGRDGLYPPNGISDVICDQQSTMAV
jgi:hypothetical protein